MTIPSDDEILWYPMRVTYNREMKVKSVLDELKIQNFIPMHYKLVYSAGSPSQVLVPAIHNLVFVRSSKNTLVELKKGDPRFEPLRFMTRPSTQGLETNEIIVVPESQMENFLRVASIQDDSVIFLKNKDFIAKVGKKVRITDGYFKGVEGEVKRIQKNKCVVVQIEGVSAVAITFVPPAFIEEV